MEEKYLFWAVTTVQWAMMLVMFLVKFKMFTIVGYFLIPMLILQTLTVCLFTFQIGKHLMRLQLRPIFYLCARRWTT